MEAVFRHVVENMSSPEYHNYASPIRRAFRTHRSKSLEDHQTIPPSSPPQLANTLHMMPMYDEYVWAIPSDTMVHLCTYGDWFGLVLFSAANHTIGTLTVEMIAQPQPLEGVEGETVSLTFRAGKTRSTHTIDTVRKQVALLVNRSTQPTLMQWSLWVREVMSEGTIIRKRRWTDEDTAMLEDMTKDVMFVTELPNSERDIELSPRFFYDEGKPLHPGQLSPANFARLFFPFIGHDHHFIEHGDVTKLVNTRKRKHHSPNPSPDTPEEQRYSLSKVRSERHVQAYYDKVANPSSSVLWAYLFARTAQVDFVKHVNRQTSQRRAAGGNGEVTFQNIRIPLKIAGETIILSCGVKTMLSKTKDSLEMEFYNMCVAYRSLHPYWPFFVEPYVLINERNNVFQTAFQVNATTFQTHSDHVADNKLVFQQIPHAMDLHRFLKDFERRLPSLVNELWKCILFFLKETSGLFEHNDFHLSNILLDTLDNDFHQSPRTWTHVRYHFPKPRQGRKERIFIFPFRWYVIDLARSKFHPTVDAKYPFSTFGSSIPQIERYIDASLPAYPPHPFEETIPVLPIPDVYRTVPGWSSQSIRFA